MNVNIYQDLGEVEMVTLTISPNKPTYNEVLKKNVDASQCTMYNVILVNYIIVKNH